jgi:hypothetical protein
MLIVIMMSVIMLNLVILSIIMASAIILSCTLTPNLRMMRRVSNPCATYAGLDNT